MSEPNPRVVIIDLRVPFSRLVLFFINAMFAIILAAIVVGAALMVVSAFAAAMLGGNLDVLMQRWMP